MGGTELDGGLTSNAVVFMRYLIGKLLEDGGSRYRDWLSGFEEGQLSALKEVHEGLTRCATFLRKPPQVGFGVQSMS